MMSALLKLREVLLLKRKEEENSYWFPKLRNFIVVDGYHMPDKFLFDIEMAGPGWNMKLKDDL